MLQLLRFIKKLMICNFLKVYNVKKQFVKLICSLKIIINELLIVSIFAATLLQFESYMLPELIVLML